MSPTTLLGTYMQNFDVTGKTPGAYIVDREKLARKARSSMRRLGRMTIVQR